MSSSSSPSPASPPSDYYIGSSPGTPNPLVPAIPSVYPQQVYSSTDIPYFVSKGEDSNKQNLSATTPAEVTSATQAKGGRKNGTNSSTTPSKGEKTGKRRQKRLERNRESARLSRRRRKQYLEVLEENVVKLSHEVDQGRRLHVSQAVWTIQSKRLERLAGPGKENSVASLRPLEQELSRTSPDLAVVNTFLSQQLKSFALPPSTKFTLWLSLQNDEFFRGGRAPSERLSAARIGERVSFFGVFGVPCRKITDSEFFIPLILLTVKMASSGTACVTPQQTMWPLFCNEVGLSYEQEEKARNYQKTLLLTQESWLHRHSAFAAGKTMQSLHDAVQALTHNMGQRERSAQSVLSEQQRLRLATWATRNRERLKAKVSGATPARLIHDVSKQYKPSSNYHVAANLYSLNHQLQTVLKSLPQAPHLVTGTNLKKLSRRPLFESLSCGSKLENEEGKLSRENSFASTGSLKRSMNEMRMDDDDDERLSNPAVNPQEAQAAAAALVEKTLGHLKDIMPAPPTPAAVMMGVSSSNIVIPSPTPVSSMTVPASMPMALPKQIGMPTQDPYHPGAPEPKHARRSSFIPPHLNVVPEEMWPADGTDDFLMDLVDGDWAIGESLEMDIPT